MLTSKIRELAARFYQETVELRRHMHRHPELSFQESETAAYISSKLSQWGIPHQTGISGHGIVGIIEGRNPEAICIALRADMDALPITETGSHDYVSLNTGVMHACGHDAHTAMLLTAARILNELRNHFEGSVKLVFQPAEEKLPGGAIGMIEAGVLRKPDVEVMLGQHVLPSLEAGKVGFRSGPFMASSDEITIRVQGKGGHAAMPHLLNDTILTASQIVVALQQLASRLAPPLVPTVLSFGRITGNGAHNVIPDEVIIQGTFRTFDERWRAAAKDHIRRIATSTAEAAGAKALVEITDGYPVLVNDELSTLKAIKAAQEYLGEDQVVILDSRMTAEDFAWYGHYVPSCFYRIGTANLTKGIIANLHTPNFDIEESALESGSGLMAWLAFCQLAQDF
jgi:amidohydrolase